MSPEQSQGRSDIDGRSDLYSLGVMGFAMIAGRLPFEGTCAAEVMAQHLTKEAPTLASVAPEAPTELGVAIARCLAKRPEMRWPDAGSFQAALAGATEDELPIQFEGVTSFVYLTLASALVLLYAGAWWAGAGVVEGPLVLVPVWAGFFTIVGAVMVVARL